MERYELLVREPTGMDVVPTGSAYLFVYHGDVGRTCLLSSEGLSVEAMERHLVEPLGERGIKVVREPRTERDPAWGPIRDANLVEKLQCRVAELTALVLALSERCHKQSVLLSANAERMQ